MRRFIPLLLAAALAAPAHAAPDAPVPLSPKLAAVLKGRAAGTPVDCISLPATRGSRIVDNMAIIYKQSARRWYVNFPAGGTCTALDPRRAVLTRIPTTRLCRMDLVTVVDLPQGFDFGSCALGAFIPYEK